MIKIAMLIIVILLYTLVFDFIFGQLVASKLYIQCLLLTAVLLVVLPGLKNLLLLLKRKKWKKKNIYGFVDLRDLDFHCRDQSDKAWLKKVQAKQAKIRKEYGL
tara:strand:+ start:474 stop:785 length:312 start_codon:yes stop_codon:yes gene_type:complete